MSAGLRATVVGATGLVGREIVTLLEERHVELAELRLYASSRSAGEDMDFAGDTLRVEELPRTLEAIDLVFLCATPEVSREIAPELASAGATVLDLTSAHREAGAALVLPGMWDASRVVASTSRAGVVLAIPDPVTALLSIPLRALATRTPLRRAIVSAIASASFAGRAAVDRLGADTASLLSGREPEGEEDVVSPAFNCVPIEGVAPSIARDLGRLVGGDVRYVITVTRAPVFFGLGAHVAVELTEPTSEKEILAWLRDTPSVLLTEPSTSAVSLRGAVGEEAIQIGAIAVDPADPTWVRFWAAADNVHQGAALNAVAVAEAVIRRRTAH